MLTEICQYLRNWFERGKYFSEFIITDGALTFSDGSVVPLVEGQYFRVVGSLFNDGVHKYGDATDPLTDEAFDGAVWSMAVPPDFVALCDRISAWCDGNQAAMDSPYSSESFGGYSYSLRTGGGSDGTTGGVTWQSQFSAALGPWRKI